MSKFPEFEVDDTFLKRVLWYRYRADVILGCYISRFHRIGGVPGVGSGGRLMKKLRGRNFWIATR